ncbi:MAG: hypothetical protein GY714_29735, partial [Desulfobacterales bacterium]|nr:hypothetical protein [Desulfobacterales bacterium]
MNIEFHYYTIYYLAKEAGFNHSDSKIIAYSSQFVDNNLIAYSIKTQKEIYKTKASQNYGFWDNSFPEEAYIPFHFFPGNTDYPASK